jgi:hypothetical protein
LVFNFSLYYLRPLERPPPELELRPLLPPLLLLEEPDEEPELLLPGEE